MQDTNKDYKFSSLYVMERLIKIHLSPYKARISLAVMFMVIAALCGAVTVKLVKPMIDKIFIDKDRNLLFFLPSIVLFIQIIKAFAEYFQNYLVKYVGQRVLTDLQTLLYNHLLTLDFEYIHKYSSGNLVSRFTNDISIMRGAVSNLLVGIAKHLLNVIFLIIIMFNLEPFLSFMIFFVFPLSLYPVLRIGKRMRNLSIYSQEQLGIYTSKLDETFNSIQIVKSFKAEEFESKRAKDILENIFNLYKRSVKFDSLTSPIVEILSGCAIFIIMIYGGNLIIEGKSTPGALFAFIIAFVSAYRPFKSLLALNVNIQDGIAAGKRLFDVIDLKPNVTNSENPQKIDFSKAIIKLQDVALNYENKNALCGVDLEIKNNSNIALVGKSGSGKTSIANLILRFYDPSSGKIEISGVDLKDIDISDLRENIALVTQNTLLFDSTIADNISYGRDDVSREDIIEAAKSANAHEFIMQFEKNYDTILGPQGRILSGGQRQRIAIARAFLKKAPILILDEATSSLDSVTETNIRGAISSLCQNRTVIFITHKLSSIENFDVIYVVKDGKIIESGNHKNLLSLNGEYCNLLRGEEI